MPDTVDLDINYLRLATLHGLNLSKDPQRKLGAVLVSVDGRSTALGYNGLATKVPDTPENWERPRKYELVVHAELNALINAPFDSRGSTIYCRLKPCHRCASPLVNAGVARFVWFEDYEAAFVGDDEEIFDLVTANIAKTAYPMDRLTRSILELYQVDHDNYGLTHWLPGQGG